jgi:bifunctional UDP-N-acetylglucosamine pyrophosphorylase/glucosamine-1-phosphate N-acetyltransferase
MTTTQGSAVLVLAAGAGTRMRSDTPKVLHTLGGRSMLSHALHAVTKVAPQYLVVVLGKDRERIAPVVGELATGLGRPVEIALQEQQMGTGHAALCGLAALPEDFDGTVVITSGDIPLLDADTLADLIATHSGKSAAVTVLTTTVPDAHGYGRILRTQDGEVIAIVEETDATPQQRAIREINAGVYAFDIAALRSALSRLSSDNAQHELYLTDAIAIVRADGQIVHAKHVEDSALVAGVNDRVQLADLGAEPPGGGRPPAGRGHGDRSGHDVDRRRRHDRSRHRHRPRNTIAGRHPHRQPLPDRTGHHPGRHAGR